MTNGLALVAAAKMGRSHRRSARARTAPAPDADAPCSVCPQEQIDSDEYEELPIRRWPSQVQLSSSAVVEYEHAAADGDADTWRPGMQHDEDLDAHVNSSHPTCRPTEPQYGRSQVKVDWARLAAILDSTELSPSAKCVDRASGPDAPPEILVHRGCQASPGGCTTAQGSPWYLLGATALIGLGCALGYGLALSTGLDSDECALSSSGAPQVAAPELHMHTTADSLRNCRSELLGEQNERTRAQAAVEKCDVERKNLLVQLHYMATEMLKPSR